MIRRFCTLRFVMRPETEISNRYKAAIWYDSDDIMSAQFISYPDRKRAEREILLCLVAEAEAWADDAAESTYRADVLASFRAAKTLDDIKEFIV